MTDYNDIKHLSTKDHLRFRSGMYIGDKATPNHLFTEAIDNSIDEALVGYCKNLIIDIYEDHFIVQDDGRGFPLGIDPETGKYYANIAITEVNSGGKYSNKSYSVSSGIHGVGLKAITYISDYFKVITWRSSDAKQYTIELKDGDITLESLEDLKGRKGSGTILEVYPLTKWKDPIDGTQYDHFFETLELNFDPIIERLRLVKTLIPKLSIKLRHYKKSNYKEFTEIQPISDEELLDLDSNIFGISGVVKEGNHEGETFNIKFGYDNNKTNYKLGLCTINMLKVQNGIHIRVVETALRLAFQDYIRKLDESLVEFLQDSDYLAGLRLSIFLTLKSPSYTSQTKESLAGSIKSYEYMISEISKAFRKWVWDPDNREFVLSVISRMKLIRENANKSGNFKLIDKEVSFGKVNSEGFISRKLDHKSKIVECLGKKVEDTELFILEGDSASSGLITKRDPKKHAILPLRGKVLNIIGLPIKRILENVEMRDIINSIGIGCFENIKMEKCRYSKIIIATDRDRDGLQIQALLLGAFAYMMPEIIQEGRLFITDIPLFIQYIKGKKIKCRDEKDLVPGFPFDRFKGVGSYPLDMIPELFFDPEKRSLVQVTLDDCNEVLKIVGNGGYRKEMLKSSGIVVD